LCTEKEILQITLPLFSPHFQSLCLVFDRFVLVGI
jgi:hypothetical protein